MEADVITLRFKPGMLGRGVELWRERLLSFRQHRGFRQGMVLADDQTHVALVVHIWQSELDAHAFGRSDDYSGFLAAVNDLLLYPAQREVYEVAAATVEVVQQRAAG